MLCVACVGDHAQWQPARHKENGVTVDDGIRPFSVELELMNGDKVLCAVRQSDQIKFLCI